MGLETSNRPPGLPRDLRDRREQAGGRAPVRVRVERADAELLTAVEVEGGDPAAYESALVHAADRALALGGELRVTGGVAIEMRTPCAS